MPTRKSGSKPGIVTHDTQPSCVAVGVVDGREEHPGRGGPGGDRALPVFRLLDPSRVRSPLNLRPADRENVPSGRRASFPDHFAFRAEAASAAARREATPRLGGAAVLTVGYARGCAAPGLLLPGESAEAGAYAREQTSRGASRRREVVLDQHGRQLSAAVYWHEPMPAAGEWVAAEREGRRLCVVASVFVYGTLLAGESRAWILDEHGGPASRLPARVQAILVDCGPFPALLAAPRRPDHEDDESRVESPTVVGELVTPGHIGAALERLDDVEGFGGFGRPGSLYCRTLVRIAVDEGQPEWAWVYRMSSNAQRCPPIPSGSWRARHIPMAAFTDEEARDYGVYGLTLAHVRAEIAGLTDVKVPDDWRPRHDRCPSWGGADAIFVESSSDDPSNDVEAVSPHARAIGWLLIRVWRHLSHDGLPPVSRYVLLSHPDHP